MKDDIAVQFPLVQNMARGEEVLWLNPRCGAPSLSSAVTDAEIADAAARMDRFAPCIRRAFPESGGIIESPLEEIPASLPIKNSPTSLAPSTGGWSPRGRFSRP